jgi:hypothetical protein
VTSDGRQHGSQLLSQGMADKLLSAIAANFYGVDEKNRQAFSRPLETRGVPHGLVEGVHAALKWYGRALENLELITGSDDRQCKTGVFVLPLARYTQSLSPHVDPGADTSQRLNLHPSDDPAAYTDGRAFLPDSTAEEDAILLEPHVQRP